MTEPSALAYARHFDLTTDYRADGLWQYLQDFHSSQPVHDKPDDDYENISKQLISASEKHTFAISYDIEQAPEDVVSYLDKATIRTKAEIEGIYRKLLPDYRKTWNLKIRIPLLSIGNGDVYKDVRKIRRGIDLNRALDNVLDDCEHIEKSSSYRSELPFAMIADHVQEIVHKRLQEAARPQVMETSRTVIDYISKALPTNLNRRQRLSTIETHFPKRQEILCPQSLYLTEADFDIDSKDVYEPTLSCNDFSINNFEDVKASAGLSVEEEPNTDRDLLSYLNDAVDEEIILSGQTDEAQNFHSPATLTSDHSDPPSNFELVTLDSPDEPSCKKRKLIHDPTSTFTADFCIESALLQCEDISSKSSQLRVPVIPLESVSGALSNLDVQEMAKLYFRSYLPQSQMHEEPGDFVPPGLPRPSLRDIFKPEAQSDTSIVEKFLGKQKKIPTSGQILWKEPGFRLLDQQDNDCDDLNENDFALNEDVEQNLKSSKQLMQGPKVTSGHFQPDMDHRNICHGIPVTNHVLSERKSSEDKPRAKILSSVMNDAHDLWEKYRNSANSSKIRMLSLPLKQHISSPLRQSLLSTDDSLQNGSSSNSLASFMELRGRQFKSLTKREIAGEIEIDNDPIQCSQYSLSGHCEQTGSKVEMIQKSAVKDAITQPDVPAIEACQEPTIVFVNSSLLQQKPLLIQFMECRMGEKLNLIYRDLDSSDKRGPDLIVNTTTCLFVISLQLLSQRPLPGQQSKTGLSPAHDQVCSALRQYDRIFVLVHFMPTGDTEADLKMQTSRSEFASFCYGLASHCERGEILVTPIWLPCMQALSTSDLVNAWVWRVIRQHGYRPRACSQNQTQGALIDNVTLWELLLIKAGLNPMAAQVVIGFLKPPAGMVESGMDVNWGLRRLMQMGNEERHKMFDAAIGQSAVERLCEAVSR